MKIQDEQERLRALDLTKSFIVQAPAGSGKTELLTQRFLVLLGHVKQPEEILAITFTKKSAAEMRARIVNALTNALNNPEPESPHAKRTWHLAKKVLQQDQVLEWNLLASPNRLRLQTIDSFNTSLTRQLPVLSHFGATPDIADDSFQLYRQAVQEFLSHLEDDHSWSDAIATILLHMDNDLNKVEALLINLLAKRDQWLRHITLNSTHPFLRKKLEESLAAILTDILTKLQNDFPKQHSGELLALARFAAQHVILLNPESPVSSCIDLTELPGNSTQDKKYWLGLRELLFTKNDDWRKKLDKDLGFPPATYFKNPDEKNLASDMKIRMSELIQTLSENTDLKNLFQDLNCAPDIVYHESQWQTLEALHQVLQVVAAQLKLVFQQHGKIDYIENALAAHAALGTEDAPTDLTLALDYQIKHVLVDEFQDTSNGQYLLLKKITAGWEANDGRTLFLVGDPMQSIYRFREAEVGIFIRARKHGIGNVALLPLVLSVNFRSIPGIVNWVNDHFQHVFPSFDDIATGAVSYSQSLANRAADMHESPVTLNAFVESEREEQAEAIVELIQARKKSDPTGTIAILVRSRTHLEAIIPALKKAQLAYRAIDIDPLTERPFIQDLMALTRALLHPADRIAWLAILRAPWCGLSLSDLLILSGNDAKISLWERLQSIEIIQQTSPDGQERLKRIMPVLKTKLHERRRISLRYWIESTWLLLGGPACVSQSTDLEDATAFFKLLETLDQGGDLVNLDTLSTYVSKLYAAPNNQADDTLQIMTIHNAKGLEFDTVILPHLERKSSNDDKQLLLWMERPRADDTTGLILAPVHAIGNDVDSIYEYIKQQHAIKNDYERARLLYVAATRAKKHLDLFFNLKDEKKVTANSLLEKLWPAIKNEVNQLTIENKSVKYQFTTEEITPPTYKPQPIKRLMQAWKNPVYENRLAETIVYHQKKMGFLLPDNDPKFTGTLIHQILQNIGCFGVTWWQEQSKPAKSAYLKQNLLQLGMINSEINTVVISINQAIDSMLEDTRGRWILTTHTDAQTEFHITAVIDQEPQQLIIDRTFIDENNVRWIIDYKTSSCEKHELDEFMAREKQKYEKQMWHYFQAMREMDSRSIRLGLYFPLMCAWHEWEFEG